MWSSVLLGKCICLCTLVLFFIFMKAVGSVGSSRSVDGTRSDLLQKNFISTQSSDLDTVDSKYYNTTLTKSERFFVNGFLESNSSSPESLVFNAQRVNSSQVQSRAEFAGSNFTWYQEIFKGLSLVVKQCLGKVRCYRERILRGLDRLIKARSLQIADGIFLVKEQGDMSGVSRESEDEGEPFLLTVSLKVVEFLETHALRVRLGVMTEAVNEARFGPHRHYKHAFPMLVGSFMVLAAFLVPMGFQFLAVVGGKALVLSQIALVLAMGSSLQRFFGFGGPGSYRQGGAGYVQHDYYLRSDNQPPPSPWHREGVEGKHRLDQQTYPRQQLSHDHDEPLNVHESYIHNDAHDHLAYLQQQLSQHQLQGLMNHQQV